MSLPPPLATSNPDGSFQLWQPTTLDQLGKMERFLEDAIVAQPSLLGLESVRSGIRRPWKVFRTIGLATPTARGIEADVILFCASGHIVVVEVKRSVNPELRDRQVIAQLLDYATSVQTLSESQLLDTFRMPSESAADWPSLVATWFPDEPDHDALATQFLRNLERGEINLVIACDRAPAGVAALVSALARQAATGFELDLVEIVPYCLSNDGNTSIVLVPFGRVSTEIIARTAVTIEYRQTEGRPLTTVTTTPIDQIAEGVREVESGAGLPKRLWTEQEVELEVRKKNWAIGTRLYDFAVRHSYGAGVVNPGKKLNPVWGFYLPYRTSTGDVTRRMVFAGNPWDLKESINFYFRYIEDSVDAATLNEFVQKLNAILGPIIQPGTAEQYIAFNVIGPKIGEFENALIWLQAKAHERANIP